MKSEIKIHKPPMRVYFTIGLFAAVVIVSSMVLMPDVWRVALYGLIGTGAVGWLSKQAMSIRQNRELHKRQVKLMDYEIEAKRFLTFPASHRAIDLATGLMLAFPSQVVGGIIEGEMIEQRRNIFDLLRDGTHFLLVGNDGSGKTTLANHIIDALCIGAAVAYVLDPHGKFNNWSAKAQLIDDYEAIQKTLHRLFLEMTRRYEAGPGDYPTLIIAIDEWPAVVDECPAVADYLKRISREGRKVQVRMIVMSQSRLVEDIGNNSSVRNNFVRIELDRETTRQNLATIRHWDKRTEVVELAGTYGVQGRWFNGPSTALSLPEPEPEPMTDEERRIIEAHQQHESYRDISSAVWGDGKVGTWYNEKIRAAIEKWGREP